MRKITTQKFIKMAQAELNQELWIEDGGHAIDADGDIGDYNHEAYVIETVIMENDLEEVFDASGFQDKFYEKFEDEILEGLVERNYVSQEQIQQFKNQDMSTKEILEHLNEQYWVDVDDQDLLKLIGVPEEEVAIISGWGDPRLYAIKNWGWKRVLGGLIETWTLNQSDIRDIAEGIFEIYGEELEDDQDLTIEIKSSNETIDTTIGELKSGRIEKEQSNIQQEGYQNVFDAYDKPSSSYYQRFGD